MFTLLIDHSRVAVAKEILTRNTNGAIRFRGFLVGNPYVDPFTNTVAQFQAFYLHGLVAKPLYDEWVKACADRNHYHPVVRELFFVERNDLVCY